MTVSNRNRTQLVISLGEGAPGVKLRAVLDGAAKAANKLISVWARDVLAESAALPKPKKLGECCPVMQLVMQRDVQMGGHPRGFEVAPYFNLKGGSGEALVYKFAKAKKTTTGDYGYGSKYADTIYATVAHCPFCGAKLKKLSE